MLMRAGDQQTSAVDTAKWQSFSIRSVLGDALNDDDDEEEEDLDVEVDTGRLLDSTDRRTMPSGDGVFPAGLSPSAASCCSNSGAGDDVASQDENVHKASQSSSSLRCTDELRHFSRCWPAFQAASDVIITSAQHPTAALNNRYSNHGIDSYTHNNVSFLSFFSFCFCILRINVFIKIVTNIGILILTSVFFCCMLYVLHLQFAACL